MTNNEVDPGLRGHIERLNGFADRTYLLADEIAHWQDSHTVYKPLPLEIYDKLDELKETIYDLSALEVVFSGTGCIPVTLPGGEADTIFGSAASLRGNLRDIYIAHTAELVFVDKESLDEILDEADDDQDSGDVLGYSRHVEILKSNMLQPKEGLGLFIDIELYDEVGETEMHGTSIRAQGVTVYATIDATSFQIEYVEQAPDLSDSDEIGIFLIEEAKAMRRLLRDTRFRRLPVKSQRQFLENEIVRLNDLIRIDRYAAEVSPQDIYVPVVKGGVQTMDHIVLESSLMLFEADMIYVDSLEHFALSNGCRITRDNSMRDSSSGFCLVAQIGQDVQEMIGISTDIIWIPVRPRVSRLCKNGTNAEGFEGVFYVKKPQTIRFA